MSSLSPSQLWTLKTTAALLTVSVGCVFCSNHLGDVHIPSNEPVAHEDSGHRQGGRQGRGHVRAVALGFRLLVGDDCEGRQHHALSAAGSIESLTQVRPSHVLL